MKRNSMFKFVFVFALASIVLFNSCKKQDKEETPLPEENELITTISLQVVDTLSLDTFVFSWRQPGGAGTAISVDTIKLAANKGYRVSIDLLDESKNPVASITEEIEGDANSHRFVYSTNVAGTSIKILDYDKQVPAMELGLKFLLGAGAAGAGNFNVLLKHYTDLDPKTNGVNAGSTDIEVAFPMLIK